MTLRSIKLRAIVALVLSQALLIGVLVWRGDRVYLSGGGLLAAISAVAWWRRGSVGALVLTGASGALPAFGQLTQPMGLTVRLATATGALALLTFAEYGHLAHRLGRAEIDTDDAAVIQPLTGRLTRVLIWTTVATLSVVALTTIPNTWMAAPLGNSVEMLGSLGVVLVGVAMGCLLVGLSRGMQAAAGWGQPEDS